MGLRRILMVNRKYCMVPINREVKRKKENANLYLNCWVCSMVGEDLLFSEIKTALMFISSGVIPSFFKL